MAHTEEKPHDLESSFLANISHELRTPLNGIIGLTSLLEQSKQDREQRWYTQMILKSSQSLLTIIENILDYSRIESGKIEPHITSLNLHTELYRWLDLLALQSYQKHLEFSIYISPEIPDYIISDITFLERILVNLVGNALKFTEQGSIRLVCTLETDKQNTPFCKFSVTDTGKGIAPSHLHKIFERFTQEDSSITRRYGGTGLGLAICRQFVELLKGTIRVESPATGGATFSFTIPYQTVPQAKKLFKSGKIDTTFLLISPESCVNMPVIKEYLKFCNVQFKHIHNSMGTHTLAERFNMLIIDNCLLEDKSDLFLNDLRLSFGAGNIIVIVNPLSYHRWLDNITFKGIHLISKPVNMNVLCQIITGEALRPVRKTLDNLPGISSVQKEPDSESNKIPILVAEDNEINQIFVRKTLEQKGYLVTLATNGREAVNILKKQSFTLVLMDIQMPEMDGIEATIAIRENEKNTGNRIPIIALTASTADKESRICYDAGMDGFIAKPISAPNLIEKVNNFVKELGNRKPAITSTSTLNQNASITNQKSQNYCNALINIGGDAGLFGDLITILLKRWPKLIDQAVADHTTGDLANLAKTLHTIKGSVGVFSSKDFVKNMSGYIEKLRAGQLIDFAVCKKDLDDESVFIAGLAKENGSGT